MLVFDFDGVLIDSMDEVTLNTFNLATGRLARGLEEIPAEFVERFQLNRFHIQPACDFLAFGLWCLRNLAQPSRVLSKTEYAEIRRSVDGASADRAEEFFSTRRRRNALDPISWLNLNRPYQPIWDQMTERRRDRIIILTNKNKSAVVDLTSHFKLTLEPELIFSGDGGVTKVENFARIEALFGKRRYYLIDDSLPNLLELGEQIDDSRLKMILADWGYLGPSDIAEAAIVKFEVFNQEQGVHAFDRMNNF